MDKDIDNEELEKDALDETCACGGDSEDCTCDDESEEDLIVDESEDKEDDKETMSESDESDEEEKEMDDLVEGLAKVLGIKKASVAKLKEAFATAVTLKTESTTRSIEKNMRAEAIEAVKAARAKLDEDYRKKLDGYAKVVVSEWIKENAPQIKLTVEHKRNEKIINGLRRLFEENAVTIDDEDKDVVEELTDELDDIKNESSKINAQNAKYRALLEGYAKKEEIAQYSLTKEQADKVYSLVESFPIDTKIKDRIKTVVDLIESAKPAKPAMKIQEKNARKPIAEQLVESFAPKKVVKPQQDIDAVSFLKDLLK